MTSLHKDDLDDFIRKIDASGGPAVPDFQQRWGALRYVPSIRIDSALDPYDSHYSELMCSIYEEISGRPYNCGNEIMDFDFQHHVSGLTAYGGQTHAAEIALHFQRLSCAIRAAELVAGAPVLDAGCGWGLSSEILAQCGLVVTAIDINPKFVKLVQARSDRLGYPITAVLSSFEDFQTDQRFDGILFYECLHHAVRPWELIRKLAGFLHERGRILLAGEPIQSEFWEHWGLRLDALSIYCIRKFGWFESGWSIGFLKDMFARAGLLVRVKTDADPRVGMVVVAERPFKPLCAAELAAFVDAADWYISEAHLISTGRGSINILPPAGISMIALELANFRGRPIRMRIEGLGQTLCECTLSPGSNIIEVPVRRGLAEITLCGETWIPAQELGTQDNRKLSFHLSRLEFLREGCKQTLGVV